MSIRSEYSDGELENWLLDYFSGKPLPAGVDMDSNWGIQYYLSPQRGGLLNWFEFEQGSTVLEIGAGPGAITEALVQNDVFVTALELSPKRAKINQLRNKKAKNLEVIVGNLQDFKPKQRFDYVVCVGVLEYAGLFMKSHQNAHSEFINILTTLLKPEGTLLLAIENRLGLKYWAGAKEDHTERFFDSLNDYPSELGLKTFGKQELSELLGENGLINQSFYYPYPDYKMPSLIYSDKYLPGVDADFPIGILPTPSPSQSRLHLFSESMAMQSLERNKLFDEFSNSFLVLASEKNTKPADGQPSLIVQPSRTANYSLQTKLFTNAETGRAIKKALSDDALTHINKLEQSFNQLKKYAPEELTITPVSLDHKNKTATFPYVKGRSVETKFFELIQNDDRDRALKLFKRYIKLIDSLPSVKTVPSANSGFAKIFGQKSIAEVECSKVGLIDLNFDNIIEDDASKWHLIDYEWCYDFPIPKSYMIGRTLWWFFGLRHCENMRLMSEKIEMLEIAQSIVVPKYLYENFKEHFKSIINALTMEENFQAFVHNKELKHISYWELYPEPKVAKKPIQLLDQYMIDQKHLTDQGATLLELRQQLEQTQKLFDELNSKHQVVVNSRAYKTLEKARKIKRKISPKNSPKS